MPNFPVVRPNLAEIDHPRMRTEADRRDRTGLDRLAHRAHRDLQPFSGLLCSQ
jgi:hypothetical protein